MEKTKKLCPRLLDYIIIVGSRHPNRNNTVAQTPELLRRYPLEDHKDFPLSPDVIFFCQPEGCISIGPKRISLRENTSFVFMLTEKDSGISRYGICVNFYRPFDRKVHVSERSKPERHTSIVSTTSSSSGEHAQTGLSVPHKHVDGSMRSPRSKRKQKMASRVRNHTLTSLCLISHHPFFSTFRECLFVLRKLIDACNERSCSRRIGGSKASVRDSVWGLMTGAATESSSSLVMHEVREIETWILRLLSAPVPVPGKTRVEVSILPRELHSPMLFALPDHTRFTLVDFPLHLPLELLGVDVCLKVLSCIMLEHKIIVQSRDYNALSMSVMAFVSMLYPLEYMFPVIPLLPTCMASAEQLLLAPTPYIIGIPASFLMYKKNFVLPDDVWLVDLDSNKIIQPNNAEELPPMPEPEGSVLKNHLKQALASMSMTPQPIKNLEVIAQNPDMWKRRESFSSSTGFNPLIYGNDVDSVDVATRVAMVRFFNSPNILGNFSEHTRTLRLYPRPVVAFQMGSFLKSRPVKTHFTVKLARTQAVEFFAEWALCPKNVVFLRVQTGVFDPLLIGDKPKWYSQSLQKIDFHIYDENSSTLAAALATCLENQPSDDNPTDESGSDSDGAESTSSSYSSLSDFVIDIQNSEINGETPEIYAEDQVLTVDESRVFSPPSQLHVPDTPLSNSDSALSAPDSDDGSSSDSSSPEYAKEPPEEERPPRVPHPSLKDTVPLTQHEMTTNSALTGTSPRTDDGVFRYDSGNLTPTHKSDAVFRYDSGRVTPTRRDDTVFRYDSGHITPTKKEQFKYESATDLITSKSPSSTTPELMRRRMPNSHSPSLRSVDSAYESMVDRRSLSERRTAEQARAQMSRGSSEIVMSRSRSSSGSSKVPPQRPPPPAVVLTRGRSPGSTSSASPPLTPKPNLSPGGARSQPPSTSPSLATSAATAVPSTGTLPPSTGGSTVKPTEADVDKSGNLISTVTDELNGFAQSASNTLSELLGAVKSAPVTQTLEGMPYISDIVNRDSSEHVKPGAVHMSHSSGSGRGSPASSTTSTKSTKPFAPLGNRKALVEKSGLVKHSSQRKTKELPKQASIDHRASTHSDNQQFLKDVVNNVLEGQGVGWLKLNRVKKLMDDENYRNFVVSRLNTSLDKKLSDDDTHLEDVCVSKQVFKGLLTMIKALIGGLEQTYQNQGVGGMASAFMVLEIMHTHYWEKEMSGSTKSENSKPSSLASSPFGSRESLSSLATDVKAECRSLHEEHMVAALGHSQGWQLEPTSGVGAGLYATSSSSTGTTDTGSPVVVNGDEYENIEIRKADDSEIHEFSKDIDGNRNLRNAVLTQQSPVGAGNLSDIERQRDSSGYGSESGDMLRELVKNKELMKVSRKKNLSKLSSADSDISEGSTLTSIARKKRSGSILSMKSHLSTGYRYHDDRLISMTILSPEASRTYLFEPLIGKDRSWLWDQMQFWEDSFLDTVAQERDIIGMDQGPGEMIDRYISLGDSEKKRLEYDEDRLLTTELYNMTAFMVMVRVSKNEIRRKIRRLLGKSHIGLVCSQEINNLLDQINNLHGNDIDLKPIGSRLMQKQSFTVHWGSDNTGDMLFMEVCDDCLILRSVTGSICDRWWYEKLVNMTYCPKTKVLCLWRRHQGKTQLNKFYTKKCKELYFSVKEAMEKAASRNSGRIPGPELGGEFPIQDLKTGQGGLLQVCMEGIGLLFANSKFFIELSRVKKCFTQKGGIFVLEEFDPKTRKVTQRKYQSKMADQICYAVLCVFSYLAVGMERQTEILEVAHKVRLKTS